MIDTPHKLERVHAPLRKTIKTRGHVPTYDAATKRLWLALRNVTAEWGRGAPHRRAAILPFAILYEGRFTMPAVGGTASTRNA